VRKYPGTLRAFSVGYEGRPRVDERNAAKALADHLKVPFHEVELSTADVVAAFPDLVYWQDDPIADIAGYGYYAVAKAARDQDVPVLLQGQGGDELFWGYPWVREAVRQTRRKASLHPCRPPKIVDYLRLTRPTLWPRRALLDWFLSCGSLLAGWQAYQRDRSSPPERLVFYDLAPEFASASAMAGRLYHAEFRSALGESRACDIFSIPKPWPSIETTITRLICQTFLLENGIAQGDRLAMASSVEIRLPLVDYRLVETVVGLRKTRSDIELPPKFWFKEAVKDLLPHWVLQRPKRGFQPPHRAWLPALLARYGKRIEDGVLVQHRILSPQAARALSRGSVDKSFWFKALVLELWCAHYGSQADGSAEAVGSACAALAAS
jgi:asparagine synthase (glutamine-hydrolysing)